MQLQPDESRINVEVVKHVRLFIIIWCKDNVINDVFQCLEDHLAMDRVEEIMLTVFPLPLTSSLIDGVSHTL